MTSTWLVTYTVGSEVTLDAGSPLDYPDLGLRLEAQDGLLKRFLHEFTLTGVPTDKVALDHSRSQLDQFLAAIRYAHLKPIPHWAQAQRLTPPDNALKIQMQASGTIGPRVLKTPKPGWQANTPPQLALWLLLAAEAQETPSSVSAIRFYYFVIEDFDNLKLPLVQKQAAAIKELKAIRDFVSHPTITAKSTKATLATCAPELADAAGKYSLDLSSPVQRTSLDHWRQKARAVVDGALQGWLPS